MKELLPSKALKNGLFRSFRPNDVSQIFLGRETSKNAIKNYGKIYCVGMLFKDAKL